MYRLCCHNQMNSQFGCPRKTEMIISWKVEWMKWPNLEANCQIKVASLIVFLTAAALVWTEPNKH